MQDGNAQTLELPFSPFKPARLEVQAEFGHITLLPVRDGESPHVELPRGAQDSVVVQIDKFGDVVRVGFDPTRSFPWFGGGWDIRPLVFVPRDVRASIQTSAGGVSVHDLEGCELGIKASAGKIDLVNVQGLLHLAADAGSIAGRQVGGYFDVSAHAGSIRLEITDLQHGEHRMRATMGSVRIELAEGMDVAIDTHTTMGSVRQNYPVRAAAPTRLVLSSEMGSLRVEPARFSKPASRPAPSEASTEDVYGSEPKPQPPVDPELERVLKMVESGELSAVEADELLQAMGRA